jgi:hypothetical protein
MIPKYGNKLSFSNDGIKVMENSSNNYIYNNTLEGIKNYAILARGADAINNTFRDNDMDNSEKAIRVKNNTGSLFINSDPSDITSSSNKYLVETNSTLNLEKDLFPLETMIESDNSTNNIVKISNSGVIVVRDERGNVTNINTNLPFVSRIHNETLSIVSCNRTG